MGQREDEADDSWTENGDTGRVGPNPSTPQQRREAVARIIAALSGGIRHLVRNTDVMEDCLDCLADGDPDKDAGLPNRGDGAELARLRNMVPELISALSSVSERERGLVAALEGLLEIDDDDCDLTYDDVRNRLDRARSALQSMKGE